MGSSNSAGYFLPGFRYQQNCGNPDNEYESRKDATFWSKVTTAQVRIPLRFEIHEDIDRSHYTSSDNPYK